MQSWAAKMPWGRVVVMAGLTFLLGRILVKWVAPEAIATSHVLAAIAILFTLRLLIEAPASLRRAAQARRGGCGLAEQACALLPVEILGLARLERAQQRGFVAWLRRQPLAGAQPAGEVFEHHRNSQYGTLFVLLMLSCVVELPMSSLFLPALVEDPVRRQYIHWFVLATLVYTVVWLLGDRYFVRATRSVVTADGLALRIGERFSADIPWAAVKQASRIVQTKELSEARSKWLRRHGFDPETTLLGTPIDQPNVALLLDTAVPVRIDKYKIPRQDVRHLLVYVDDPDRFVRTIDERLAERRQAA